jgi:hypothetical protein
MGEHQVCYIFTLQNKKMIITGSVVTGHNPGSTIHRVPLHIYDLFITMKPQNPVTALIAISHYDPMAKWARGYIETALLPHS